jgi:hypothetical protein
VQKWIGEAKGLIWTLGGLGITLITLSGDTRRVGSVISVGSLVAYLALVAVSKESDQ